MNKNFGTLVLAVTTAVVLMAAPASAQSGRVVVSGSFSNSGGQYGAYDRGYPDRGYGNRGYGYGGRQDYAFANGYRDGYEKGIEDARDHDRYDVWRHRRYREADRGYDRGYGYGRDAYGNIYRRGFANGYDEGYRAASRGYGRGGYRDRDRRGGFSFDWRF